MAYYVDNCSGRLMMCDDLGEAQEVAANALRNADEFKAKMGFLPFWATSVEIRRGKVMYDPSASPDLWNNTVLENTKLHRDHIKIRKAMN